MPPAFLADFSPLDGAFQNNVYSLILIVSAVAGLWLMSRRKPAVDTDLAKLTSSIDTLTTAVSKLEEANEKYSGNHAEIAHLKEEVRELKAQRGQDITEYRKYVLEVSQTFSKRIESESRITQDKLDTISNTINAEFRTLYRALGKVEGQTDERT